MVVTIKAEDTGLEDYFCYDDNLLTKALEREGFEDVYINGNEWNGRKYFFFRLIRNAYEGYISPKANTAIKHLSDFKKTKDITINLEE